ncbi:MAG: zinc transporter ZntB [Ponticaulis sp.]|nr:zinc transporter ZntB [Ponticaulis sp.]|tara:strand:+ start:48126 stop:49139 length:1014 start_codon:yes stop_codon:yes gene_type:complete
MTEQNDLLAQTIEEDKNLLFGRVLDGQGGARTIDWESAKTWTPEKPGEVLWLHLDRTQPDVMEWLRTGLDLPDATYDFLISNDTRPRAFSEDGSLVATLRGVNFNPGAKPEDMIAMHIYANEQRVLTLRRRRLQSPRDVMAALDEGHGPKTAGSLVTEVVEQLVVKVSSAILNMNERLDHLENLDVEDDFDQALDDIAAIRRNCLALKRHMSPQHEALSSIGREMFSWMNEADRRDIREGIARLQRYLEDLDVSKESALLIQDDLNSRAASQSNKTMYLLSIVAAIFLPLGFITGLLGINVGGMPGVDSAHAFWITVVLLVGLMGVQLYIFRKLKWL